MTTEDLIAALVADPGRGRRSAVGFLRAAAFAALVTGVIFVAAIGVRSDFFAALASVRFVFKLTVTGTAVVTLAIVARASLYPTFSLKDSVPMMLVAPLMLLFGANAELASTPAALWANALIGKDSMICLAVIPSLGLPLLAVIVAAMQKGAPARPGLSGLFAGLLAGAMASTFYAANGADDSPLFVAVWYPLAVAALSGAGAVAGRLFLRW